MEFLKEALDFVLHFDRHLGPIIQQYGLWTYLILFAVIFCETGLVVTPFLPGDSLLFLAGVFAGRGELSLLVLIGSLTAAAILGDTVNYWVGHFLGHRLLTAKRRIIKPEHLAYTHEFFEKYGGKTIILARFVPIVRTLAPFVAGLGSMSYGRFMSYNVIGGAAWVLICTLAGYALYSNQYVQDHFFVVEVVIVALSLLPAVWELWRARRAGRRRRGSASRHALRSPHLPNPPLPKGEEGDDNAEEKALLVPLSPLGREGPGE
jgi:membrane-associated protein